MACGIFYYIQKWMPHRAAAVDPADLQALAAQQRAGREPGDRVRPGPRVPVRHLRPHAPGPRVRARRRPLRQQRHLDRVSPLPVRGGPGLGRSAGTLAAAAERRRTGRPGGIAGPPAHLAGPGLMRRRSPAISPNIRSSLFGSAPKYLTIMTQRMRPGAGRAATPMNVPDRVPQAVATTARGMIMDSSEIFSQFAINRLDGEPLPDDLRILLPHRDELAVPAASAW